VCYQFKLRHSRQRIICRNSTMVWLSINKRNFTTRITMVRLFPRRHVTLGTSFSASTLFFPLVSLIVLAPSLLIERSLIGSLVELCSFSYPYLTMVFPCNSLFHPKDGGSKYLQHVGTFLLDYREVSKQTAILKSLFLYWEV